MWKPRDPDVFGHAVSPWSVENLAGDKSDVNDLAPIDARHRIEVDPKLVGVGEVVGPDRVRIEVDTAEVDRPHQSRGVVQHRLLRRRAGRVSQLGDVDVVGAVLLGRPLLEDGLFGDALDEPLEDHRPLGHPAQRTGATAR